MSVDELVGGRPVETPGGRANPRLWHPLRQVDALPPPDRKQILQLIAILVERETFKKRIMEAEPARSLCPASGVLMGSAATALLPLVKHQVMVLGLAAVFGAVSGIAFVAISVALAGATTPAARGLVMGGYSTSLYLGLALGSFALGPIITHRGYTVGFAVGGAAGVIGTLISALLWAIAQHPCRQSVSAPPGSSRPT